MEIIDYLLARKKAGGGSDVTIEQLTATENGTYSEEGKAYSPVVVNVPTPENSYQLKDVPSGTVSTIDDGTALPMPSLKVGIEPQQDLHRYDHPWVGGAGKNLFDIDAEHTSGTSTYMYEVYVKPNAAYTLSSNCPYSSPASLYFNGDSTEANGVGNGIPKAFNSDENGKLTIYVRIAASGPAINLYTAVKNGQYYIQLEQGSTATSYEPYSNICPISGWTEANVNVSGVNIWDEEWENGTFDTTTGENIAISAQIRSKNHIKVKPNATYYYKGAASMWAMFFDVDGNIVEKPSGFSQVVGNSVPLQANMTFTVPSNAYEFKFYIVPAYGATYKNDISINYPSTETEYHAYNGQTYTIQFRDGDNPLTVYGGTLDVTSGELVVDRAFLTNDYLVNTADYESAGRNCYVLIGITLKTLGASVIDSKLIASALKTDSQDNLYSNRVIGIAHWWNTRIAFSTGDSNVTSKSAFKEWLANNGSDVCYELAEPITYQLTPTQVRTLVGNNNIWADTGNIIEGKYFKSLT